ncbi:activating signal cointegrator 1 [Pseudomyrmex gracilis]|uniref:activating signal cointegrator 1 n=1 Tax=Pseudomyrmex gracilis TaxID=219809 RepID=UPI000994AB16|nr:activating signal cointegrator 1 [Pseudomyrmex gracilis]
MEKWVHTRLSDLLDFPISDDIPRYIMQIENDRDLEEHFASFLDIKNPKHKQFITEFKKQRALHSNQVGYKKTNDNDNAIRNKQYDKKQNDKKKGKGKENVQAQESAKPEKVEKKKPKFVNVSQGNVLLKGRHKCNCEAKEHQLVNNCLNCGRIVCQQEGAGPCYFCNELVCTPEEQAILQSNSKKADRLFKKLMEKKPKGYEESLKQRDKLLEFDRNSARRTKVIDDESDYYQSSNIWLSTGEREKLQKQEADRHAAKHASRLDRNIKIDFMGRTIEETQLSFDQSDDVELEERDRIMLYDDCEFPNVCPTIEFDRPTFVEMGVSRTSQEVGNYKWCTEGKVQDKEYLEMSDQGLCLSMHQPYASLLVTGIKTHEGRSWYSSHRGRLWIASAAKVPSREEISNIEHIYRMLKSESIKFPETYPTSCLLGCVTVTDVLSQEEYRKLYPDGENDSPYVFICEDPYMLPIHLPMKGKHKIYKMDKKLHQAATKLLEKTMKERFDQ